MAVFHLCAEAWLLGAFNELKKENNEKAAPSQKITYSQLRENAVAQGAASLVTQRIFAGLL